MGFSGGRAGAVDLTHAFVCADTNLGTVGHMTSNLSMKVSIRTHSNHDVCTAAAGHHLNSFWVVDSNTPVGPGSPASNRRAAAGFTADIHNHLRGSVRHGEQDPMIAGGAALRHAWRNWKDQHPGATPPQASIAMATAVGGEVRLYRCGGGSVELRSAADDCASLRSGGPQAVTVPTPEGPSTLLLYSSAMGEIEDAGTLLSEQGTWAGLRALRAAGSEDDVALLVARHGAAR